MIIDIHSHILPGVDDGSKDLAMSIEMARSYLKNNIKKVIATPHYIQGAMDSSLEVNRIALESLKKALFKEGLDLEVFLGNEIYVTMNTCKDIHKARVASLNNTRYVLLELPMHDIPLYMENVLYELQLKDYIPIIGHPERNSKIMEDPNILYDYIKKGALAQLNLPSLEGKYGPEVKEGALTLVKHRMIHFLGTDAHRDRGRSPDVAGAIEKLKDLVTKEDFYNISYKNPQLLLEDQGIDIEEPMRYEEKKRIFKFFAKGIKSMVGRA